MTQQELVEIMGKGSQIMHVILCIEHTFQMDLYPHINNRFADWQSSVELNPK